MSSRLPKLGVSHGIAEGLSRRQTLSYQGKSLSSTVKRILSLSNGLCTGHCHPESSVERFLSPIPSPDNGPEALRHEQRSDTYVSILIQGWQFAQALTILVCLR
jgi:hypothetical protein